MKRLFTLICVAMMMVATTCLAGAKPILVLAGMSIEMGHLVERLEKPEFVKVAQHMCAKGKIGGQPVVIMFTHLGRTNAACATTAGIMKFDPSMVISTGTASATHANMKLNDIVICERLCTANVYSSEPMAPGKGYNMDKWKLETLEFVKDGVWQAEDRYLYSDKNLVKTALTVPYEHGNLVTGTTVTSDTWIRESDWIAALQKKLGTDCSEMESFAIGAVASKFNLPFLAVRVIANSEFISFRPDHFVEGDELFYIQSANYCQQYVYDLVKKLGATKA
ncbi:MAG: 5'-methylthioadenosine/S-adenosylhomocysteine nucleosidase [Acidaminococcaceae bacterium]|nr:5'-methylthioadenosine/S-adenosylhomocysteine nucleosidase [Acidaminococcaceae bacterium]